MTAAQIKEFELLLEDADISDSEHAFTSIFEKLKSMPDSAMTFYFRGLVCYMHPDREEFRLLQAEAEFNKALKAAPELHIAKMQLAYVLFDLGAYGKALNRLNNVFNNGETIGSLLQQDRYWRVVNLLELVAVCQLNLGRWTVFQPHYQNWKVAYYRFIRTDDFYFPKELVVHTAHFLSIHGERLSETSERFFQSVSLDLIGLIRGGEGFEQVYAKELEVLKNWKGEHTLKKLLM